MWVAKDPTRLQSDSGVSYAAGLLESLLGVHAIFFRKCCAPAQI